MMRRIMGPQATNAMVLFGQVLDSSEAERVGLVWKAVPDDELQAVAVAMAARAAAGPPELVSKVKETIAAMATVDTHQAAVERELDPQVWSINQPAFAERLAALQRKIVQLDVSSSRRSSHSSSVMAYRMWSSQLPAISR